MKTKVLTLCTNCEENLENTNIDDHIRLQIPKDQYSTNSNIKNIFNVFTEDPNSIYIGDYTNEIFCCKECFIDWFVRKLKNANVKNAKKSKYKKQDMDSYIFNIPLSSLLKLMEVYFEK